MKFVIVKSWLLAVVVSLPVWSASIAGAQTCVVSNTLDVAAGSPAEPDSLRDCLNRVRSGDTITFDANVFDLTNADAGTILVLSELPALDDGNVTIEAQDRRVTVNGSGANSASGLVIASSGNTVRGLNLVGFGQSGIRIAGGATNTIGGSRNTGTGPNGQGLRISGNGTYGIEILGAGTSGNVVKGCWIGLDAGGSSSEANLGGILVNGGAQGNTIGSATLGEANVISGNTFEGITLSGAGTDDMVIIGNVIGESATVDAAGARQAIGNGSAGVFLSAAVQATHVGGEDPSEANVIANNGSNGVEVRATNSRRNSVRGNRITRNRGGGITLFDGSNDGIRPPTILSVENLGPSALGAGSTLRITGVSSQNGGVEFFNDSGSQGATLLGRAAVQTGPWVAQLDAGDVVNLTSTLTDAVGNTSAFSLFGIGDADSDNDGIPDVVEELAGTNPSDAVDHPAVAGPLSISKLQIRLNFAKANKDGIGVKASLSLPPGFDAAGATVGISVAGYAEQLVLDAKGKGKSELSSLAVKSSKKTGPYVQYALKNADLEARLASLGLLDATIVKPGRTFLIPVAVAIGGEVHFATVAVVYKAKAGKSGKAK
ncbi:MAG: hypothetical protein ABIR79_22215 [Candidatus Binatia bacterium]